MDTKTVKIYRIDGSLIGKYPGETIREALENAVRAGANLRYANLRSANLRYANLRYADLESADLESANLRYANLGSADLESADLESADLRSANLRYANLRYADLESADLRSANLPAPTMLLLATWGTLSDEATIALMRLDASAHPDPATFDSWAAGGACPYSGIKVERVCQFNERRELWSPGAPPTIWQALEMVLDEKCPGWREADTERKG